MKLIKLSKDKIYDVDTVTLYTITRGTLNSALTCDVPVHRNDDPKGLILYDDDALNLWGYLESNASNESWRTE